MKQKMNSQSIQELPPICHCTNFLHYFKGTIIFKDQAPCTRFFADLLPNLQQKFQQDSNPLETLKASF